MPFVRVDYQSRVSKRPKAVIEVLVNKSFLLKCSLFCLICVGSAPNLSAAGGTDITGAPSEWRGTLLDGSKAVVATNKYGEPLFVQADLNVAPVFAPKPITSETLARELKSLCMDTGFSEAKLATAARSSSFALTRKPVSIAALKSGPPFSGNVWYSPEARVQIWASEMGALKNRPTLSRWRRGATASPFNATRTLAPACNITAMAKGYRDPQAFVTAVSALVGAAPAKSVIKPEWADGYWSIANADKSETRIGFSFVDFDKQEQLLHVSVAQLRPKK
jgi:hypothetical protein